MRLPIFLMLLASAPASLAAGDARTFLEYGGLRFGSLLEKETTYDCGCSFYAPAEKKDHGAEVLQWADGEMAHMFVAGKLVSLKVESSMPAATKLNKTVPLNLSGANISVQGSLNSTLVCPAHTESCEATEFTGTLNVESEGRKASIPVWGSCGC